MEAVLNFLCNNTRQVSQLQEGELVVVVTHHHDDLRASWVCTKTFYVGTRPRSCRFFACTTPFRILRLHDPLTSDADFEENRAFLLAQAAEHLRTAAVQAVLWLCADEDNDLRTNKLHLLVASGQKAAHVFTLEETDEDAVARYERVVSTPVGLEE